MLTTFAAILILAAGAAAIPLIFQVEIILAAYRIAPDHPIIASLLIRSVMSAPYFIAGSTATAATIILTNLAHHTGQRPGGST